MATARAATAAAANCWAALLHSRKGAPPASRLSAPFSRHLLGAARRGQLIDTALLLRTVGRPPVAPMSAKGGFASMAPRAVHDSAVKNRELLVQHLLVKDEQLPLLLELQKRILQEGEDLSDLATEHSICPSKSDGGMIGWISRGRTVKEFEEAAFNAPLNKVVRVKTKYGWHLLQVLAERQEAKLEQIQVEDFAQRLQSREDGEGDDLQLIDVREPSEIETAAIEGFSAYPLSQFGQWAPTIAEELDLEKETYVLCHHGMRSQQAAEWLKSQGFKQLYNIVGGIDAYSRKVDSSIPRY